jgi:DNA polymerase-3 subunit alpha
MKILPVNINRSARLFSRDSGILRAGLEIVRHLRRGTAREIVRERVKNGNFKGMLDFALRMASSGLHEKALENLVKAGAFSESGYSVKELVAAVPAVYRYVLKEGQGQTDSLFGNEDVTPELGHFIKNSKHEDIDISNAEMEATELFISGHPLDRVASELGRFVVDTLDRITELLYGAFIVYLFQLKVSFKYPGACLATATVCDKKGMTRAVFIPSVYKKYSSIIRNHSIYLIRGNVKSGQLFVEQIFLFDEIAAV